MIRNFKTQDIDKVMEIWLDTNIKAHDFIKAEYWKDNFSAVYEMMPQATIYVYDKEGSIQGFVGLVDTYIAGIFVNTDVQSSGIGKKLLDRCKSKLENITLSVYKNNTRGVKFYLREDFSIISEQIDSNTGYIEYNMKWIK